MRARLADGGCGSGWPLPSSGSTNAARALWRKIIIFLSQLRGFAPSREPVISARLVPEHDRLPGNPACPDDSHRNPGLAGPQAATNERSRDTSGAKARPCGCPALLPVSSQVWQR